jgi:hypothetical protein
MPPFSLLMNLGNRKIQIGGLTKSELLEHLAAAGIQLNDHARTLIAHPSFETLPQVSTLRIVELSVAELGLPDGGTIALINAQAAERGLAPCPWELAIHLRMQYLDQLEGAIGFPETRHCAPPGSLTVASPALPSAPGICNDNFPQGFYLRRIAGVLWLRGYCSGAEHVWSPEDRWVFLQV